MMPVSSPASKLDANLAEIVWLSLRVSISATCLAALIGLPIGALVAIAPRTLRLVAHVAGSACGLCVNRRPALICVNRVEF